MDQKASQRDPESMMTTQVVHRRVKKAESCDVPATDRYTANIELSNACRVFYAKRLASAEMARKKWNLPVGKREAGFTDDAEDRIASSPGDTQGGRLPGNSSIAGKMRVLRQEMASLIDQDLALMKQLLTLNETIEDLKWQRRLFSQKSVDSSYYLNSQYSLDDDELNLSYRDRLSISSPASLMGLRTSPRAANSLQRRNHVFSESQESAIDVSEDDYLNDNVSEKEAEHYSDNRHNHDQQQDSSVDSRICHKNAFISEQF